MVYASAYPRSYHIEEKKKLRNEVELDEAYVGGKNKNRHYDKKVRNSQGRACIDKTPVFGMVERDGKVRAFVVPDASALSLTHLVLRNVNRSTKIYTDEYSGYRVVRKIYDCSVVYHGRKQYVSGNAFTNTIEGFWSILKRGIIGVYHYTSRKHLQLYVTSLYSGTIHVNLQTGKGSTSSCNISINVQPIFNSFMVKSKEEQIKQVLNMDIRPRKKKRKETMEVPFDLEKFDKLLKQAIEFRPKKKR